MLKYHQTTSNLREHLITQTPWQVRPSKVRGTAAKELPLFLPPYSLSPAACQKAITDKLTRFIFKDTKPIDILHELEPIYTVLSCTTITDRVVKLNYITKST